MGIYRNGIKQVAYRNGVKQVAYKDGQRITKGLKIKTTNSFIGVGSSGSFYGYDRGDYGSFSPDQTEGYTDDINFYRGIVNSQTLQLSLERGVPFNSFQQKVYIERIDNGLTSTLGVVSTIGNSRQLNGINNGVLNETGDNSASYNIGYKKETDWSPALFASTRIGYDSSGIGSLQQDQFFNWKISSIYSNSSSDTSLINFGNADGYLIPDENYTIEVFQYDTNDNLLGTANFFKSDILNNQWICDKAFLQLIDGYLKFYMREVVDP